MNNTSIIRFLPAIPPYVRKTDAYGRDRFLYYMVIRGQEDKGPQIFFCGKFLHRIIVSGILENIVLPDLSCKQKILKWLSLLQPLYFLCENDEELTKIQKLLFSLASWRPFKSLEKTLPKPTTCLDWQKGFDFLVEKKMRNLGDYQLPDTSGSHFRAKSIPAGTEEQMMAWQKFLLENSLEAK